MILTAHQPVYLPWLGLFHKIALADKYIIFDRVQYLTRDWNNRNKIKAINGELMLTVPVKSQNHFEQLLNEVEIDNSQNWQRKHWRSLQLNYAKAPFFKTYKDFFEDTYLRHWPYLTELCDYMLAWFLETLGIDIIVEKASQYQFQGQKSGLVLDMCQQMQATHYIFGALGADYADKDAFQKANISLTFQEYHHPQYSQLHGAFISHLSIVDLLFNMGEQSLQTLMQNNITRDDLKRNSCHEVNDGDRCTP